jgi:hypothetical protein
MKISWIKELVVVVVSKVNETYASKLMDKFSSVSRKNLEIYKLNKIIYKG